MTDPERGFFVPHAEFQAVIGYRDVEKSPPLVVRQTNTLLGLYHSGVIRNPGLAKDYFHDYTLDYLKAAEEGSSALYYSIDEGIDPEIREAAGHAYVVFSQLPDRSSSYYHPKGFSRVGALRPPSSQRQYLSRIRELGLGIWQVVDGQVEPNATLEAYPPILRTFKFFEVGGNLPIRLTPDERKQEQIDREKFNDFLGGIDISL